MAEIKTEDQQGQMMQSYYRFQSRIYDATRWAFLFGRKKILKGITGLGANSTLVEVGCGTGYNLARLAPRFPNSTLIGIDVSPDMIRISGRKLASYPQVELLAEPYGGTAHPWSGQVDTILFSYSLTMINPQWSEILAQAVKDLKPGGRIYIVDFHSSTVKAFRDHMSNHHVRMEAHLDSFLESNFKVVEKEVRPAYLGLWNYFYYVGEKL